MAIQQEFLRETAAALGFTEKAFAQRMGAPWPTFEKWLLPVTAAGAREMPVIAWQLVHEIVAYEIAACNHHAGESANASLYKLFVKDVAMAETPFFDHREVNGSGESRRSKEAQEVRKS